VLQLVRHREIAVIGTASTQKHDYLRELGAIPTTYGPGLAERVRKLAPEGVNAALDLIFADVAQFCSAGLFRLRVEQTFPLEQAAKAQEVSAKGRVTGKLIISIA
jgi:NADPH:quinone reductase-like Zn-dependent oxidoreductase